MKIHPITLSTTIIIEVFCLWMFSLHTLVGVGVTIYLSLHVYLSWYNAFFAHEKWGEYR